MRAPLTLAFALAAGAALAQTPFLSKGWTFGEPDGASLYAHACAGCHFPDGGGARGAGSYPALNGDDKLASADYLLSVLLGGQHAMPALGRAMNDAQIADLVNYLRRRFAGKTDDPVTPQRAAAVRAAFR